MKIFQSFLSLFLIITLSVFTMACPSRSTIQKAINATEKIDSIIATAQAVTSSALSDNLITPEQKNTLDLKLNVLQKGSIAFKNSALTLKNETDKSKFQTLARMLEVDVIAPFVDLLSELKFIKNSTKILSAIGLIHVALVSILQAFEKEETVAQINLTWKEADLNPLAVYE